MVCVIGKYTVQLPKDLCSYKTLEAEGSTSTSC